MTKKTAPQLIHDLKPPIDSIHELASALYEMCQNSLSTEKTDLELGLEKLIEITNVLCTYMKEQFDEYVFEIKQMKKHTEISVPYYATIVVFDNDPTLMDTLRFITKGNKKKIATYKNLEQLFSELPQYTHDTAFFLDHDLGTSLNGIHIAKIIYDLGYKNLYIMSGYPIQPQEIPRYLKILNDKKDLLHFINQQEIKR